jgi:regulator of replication initiation timing
MSEEKDDGLPAAGAQVPETPETTKQEQPTLPDDPATEVERIKAEHAEVLKQAEALKAEKDQLEKRLKDNQEYISRTRNVEKTAETAARPQKTLDDYLEEVSKKFEDDPKEGLKKVIRDIAYDRDLERAEYAKAVSAAEERAFKKMLALNPESSKVLQEIEKLDAECPDLQGLSYERKVEFISLRNGNAAKKDTDVRNRVSREASLAGGVGGSISAGSKERIPSWVNDPEVVKQATGKFATKQELLNWANPARAREMYERKLAQQR